MSAHLGEVLGSLAIPAKFEPTLTVGWEESMASRPERLALVAPDVFLENREYAGLPANVDPPLRAAAERVRASPHLASLMWHYARLLYEASDYPVERTNEWPFPEDAPVGGETFRLLLVLDAVARARRLHRERGVPEAVTRATCTDVAIWVAHHRRTHAGKPGIDATGRLGWFRLHGRGEVFRLGRLQYVRLGASFGTVRAFRNRGTGEVLALAEKNIRFNSRGLFDGVAGKHDPEAWTSTLEQTPEGVAGYPVSPTGYAVRRLVHLPAAEWECAYSPDVPVLAMHIPAGGGMTLELCRQSMQAAGEFFPRYYPERTFAAIRCVSWIFNPEFPAFLPPDSNLVRFQRELHLFPVGGGGKAGLWFLFDGREDIDIKTAPRDTSLRRAFLERLEQGKNLEGGGMFYLKEDLARFGSQPYRSKWPPAVLRRLGGAW
ncbi:MAG: DUF5596 domain-containing protein [Kiritimatiellae bacterium]|nr:DUF5596 domain-containing protein [Kiritimatiellia bacterium]